jgi:hypothetical protein
MLTAWVEAFTAVTMKVRSPALWHCLVKGARRFGVYGSVRNEGNKEKKEARLKVQVICPSETSFSPRYLPLYNLYDPPCIQVFRNAFLSETLHARSRGSSVSIVTRLESPCAAHRTSYLVVQGAFVLAVKATEACSWPLASI